MYVLDELGLRRLCLVERLGCVKGWGLEIDEVFEEYKLFRWFRDFGVKTVVRDEFGKENSE